MKEVKEKICSSIEGWVSKLTAKWEGKKFKFLAKYRLGNLDMLLGVEHGWVANHVKETSKDVRLGGKSVL